jgi:transcriptional regulator with XRE-family HTH domain
MTPNELRTIRKMLGLTQAELAAALGLGRMAVVRLEAGKWPIQPYVADKLVGMIAAKESANVVKIGAKGGK